MAEGTAVSPPLAPRFYTRSPETGPLRQCEILSELYELRPVWDAEKKEYALDALTHPYSVILSQDCDLEQDFRARSQGTSFESGKILPNVLLLAMVTAAELRGEPGVNSGLWRQIEKNQQERYHYLTTVPADDDASKSGIPALGLDFKKYFAIPTDEVYRQLGANAQRRAFLASPYAEHLSHRFYTFQARVALPVDHK